MSTVPEFLKPAISFKKVHPLGSLTRAYEDDAGADMVTTTTEFLPAGKAKKIGTGIAVEIPLGYVGLVTSRSGHAKYQVSLANSVGVIDSAYRGEIMVFLENSSQEDFVVNAGERVCQLLVVPILLPTFTEVKVLSETARGEGGFGSTGKI